MNTENTTEPETAEPTGTATYSPEDNKLRLYVGRVPRDEYEALRKQGWTSTPKQSCDFVAVWTPERRDTALDYAGVILDEDQGPAERAADRAERFSVYRDKRTSEATGHADRYDAGPSAHGFQSLARAERSAARHDRVAGRACDAWSKAEYWTQRTAGVISHALHVAHPSVRMGRIKELEADLRRHEASGREDDWTTHFRLRLAYENQMLEAAGGRAGVVEMIPGGWLRGGRFMKGDQERRVLKVNKSPASGRVVSVLVRDNHASFSNHWGNPFPDGMSHVLCHTVEVERMSPDAYRAPTEQELAEFLAERKATKAAAPKKEACPLINPTDEDAEKLQALMNSRPYYRGDKPSEVVRMTQAGFSARLGGSCSTEIICETGLRHRTECGRNITRADVYKVRLCSGGYNECARVVIITDKPQKPIPWEAVEHARAKQPTLESLRPLLEEIEALVSPGFRNGFAPLLLDARYAGLVSIQSLSQVSWTDAGAEAWKQFQAEKTAAVPFVLV